MNKKKPDFSAFVTPIIAREVMAYKQQIKEQELLTKIRIIKAVKKDHVPLTQVAQAFSCHRNTVTNIVKLFEKEISDEAKELLVASHPSFNSEQLQNLFTPLLAQSRRPHHHPRQVTEEQEAEVVRLFTEEGIRVGAYRMKLHIARRFTGDSSEQAVLLQQLSVSKLKGIYKRNNFRVKKVRAANGERRNLYDYYSLGCFERLHFDVKHIVDKHALPQHIYELLSYKEIPKYEWNIIDAKTRFRFMAYSYNLNSSFGLWFLCFVVMYLRRYAVPEHIPIIIGEDNGVEFCSGSKRKEDKWNEILAVMNASVYQYDPHFDIRKNLIERSHLTDDEELFIPRGHKMTDKQSFRKEVTQYFYYWNFLRPHSGIGMQGNTPATIVSRSGLLGVKHLQEFPVLILDEVIDPLRNVIQPLLFEQYAKQNTEEIYKAKKDPKTKRNIEVKFPFLTNAQNVLTYYHVSTRIS